MRNTTHNPHFIPIQILHSSFFTNACVRGERERGLRLYLSPYSPAVSPLSVCAKVVYLSAVARPWNVLAYDRGVNLCEVSTQREEKRGRVRVGAPASCNDPSVHVYVFIHTYLASYVYLFLHFLYAAMHSAGWLLSQDINLILPAQAALHNLNGFVVVSLSLSLFEICLFSLRYYEICKWLRNSYDLKYFSF